MVTTKRYDYVPIEHIQVHPLVPNHRELSESKVRHYQDDILKNGPCRCAAMSSMAACMASET